MQLAIDWLWLVIALPLGGYALLQVLGRRIGEPRAGWIATLLVGAAFVVAAVASVEVLTGESPHHTVYLFTWIPALGLDASLLWDPLSTMMTLVVTGVGFLIHLYSVGYMHGEARFGRFFAYLNLFIASMLILVLADSFGVLFVGWELVGLSSYLLISFWFEKPVAAAAGKKAFVVNRIGDLGFLVALMLIFAAFGTLDFAPVFARAPEVLATGTATAVTLLLLVGAAGKSAQIPLYVWLPDAMEGPTPVSALIHAATMVTAGVYLVARTGALFDLAPVSAAVVAVVGAATALLAATIAVTQRDIKRVLAYSTVSQLGYMFMAVGAAGYVAGMFHLLTHAFFKALLFLGAGSVIHAMAGEQDMRKMGGLRKVMPVTFVTMVVAWLSIAGVPFFSGFWSKDEILAVLYQRGGWWIGLWALGLVTAAITGFYMSRMIYLTFFGEPRWDEDVRPHESPATMTLPLLGLAGLSAVAGLINTPFAPVLEHFLEPSFELVTQAQIPELRALWILAAVALLAAVVGILYARRRYLGAEAPPEEAGPWWQLAEQGFRVDDLYGGALVIPGRKASEALAFEVDAKVVDGAVNGVGRLVQGGADLIRPLQTGFARSYVLGILLGTVGLVAWLLARGVSW
ncbi:MAG: NADH-quinone oxidoreductase subunit L [Acidimicrobiia bacterium]